MLVGRREEALRQTAAAVEHRGAVAHVLAGDLTAPAMTEQVIEESTRAMGGLDVLVNNAGNVSAGRLEETSGEDITAMVQLNLIVPMMLTRAALPELRRAAKRDGRALVVGVASGIALLGLPFYATYAATKAGLARFDEAMRRELGGTGINVATVYPGATETPMMATSHAGADLGFERRPVDDVAAHVIATLEAGEVEINTTAKGSDSRALQKLNARDPEAVDAVLAPKLDQLYSATRTHRSI